MAKRHSVKIGIQILTIIYRLARLLLLAIIGYAVYRILLDGLFGSELLLPVLILWLFTSYIVLPIIHRFLTKIYIPNYYIGRTRTGDGLYCDPVNIAFYGTKSEIINAMKGAGWVKAAELDLKSSMKMTISTILKRSYPEAPVSSLYLFGRKQDFAFQQELNNNPHSRHHIRFWKVPNEWILPGGHDADWLAAATYDKNVGLSWFTLQLTHKIDEDIDEERDYVINTLKEANRVKEIEVVENFTTAYHSRNGGGDMVKTDGSMPFIRV